METEIDLDAYTKAQAARAKRTGEPVFLRKAQRPGWTGALPLFLWYCFDCEIFTVTHPAGYGRICCSRCHEGGRVMTWQRFRDKILKRAVGL